MVLRISDYLFPLSLKGEGEFFLKVVLLPLLNSPGEIKVTYKPYSQAYN